MTWLTCVPCCSASISGLWPEAIITPMSLKFANRLPTEPAARRLDPASACASPAALRCAAPRTVVFWVVFPASSPSSFSRCLAAFRAASAWSASAVSSSDTLNWLMPQVPNPSSAPASMARKARQSSGVTSIPSAASPARTPA